MIVRFIVGCVFVGFFKPMINFEMQNGTLSNGDAPTPPPPPEARKRIRNDSAGGGGEGWGVSLELIGTILQIRSRGLWDLGIKDDGVCYGCNWKMVKSGRFCTRTRLLLSLGLDLTSSLEAKFGATSGQVRQIRGKT